MFHSGTFLVCDVVVPYHDLEAFFSQQDFSVIRSINLSIDHNYITLVCPAHSRACWRLQYETVRSPLQLTLLVSPSISGSCIHACQTWERYTMSTMTARKNNVNSWQCDPMMTHLARALVLAPVPA
jgi:hypothetical protein